VTGLNNYTFATGSEDGSLNLWATNKTKPIQKLPNLHNGNWISSLANHPNSDLLITGASDGFLRFHKLKYKGPKKCGIEESFEVERSGVITCMQVCPSGRMLAVVVSSENRLGRWTPLKDVRSKLFLYKLN
jgi:WD40 repeat protein